MGEMLDEGSEGLGEGTVGTWLAGSLLKIRDREGAERALKANLAQREFERRRGQSNIVLKARQMGMTTWIAGRFF